VFGAPQYEQEGHEYFELDPSALEVFELNYCMLPGYYYYFRAGVQYLYNGEERIDWGDEEYIIGRPNFDSPETKVWQYGSAFGSTLNEVTSDKSWVLPSIVPNLGKPEAAEKIRTEERKVEGYRTSFTPPKLLTPPK
jgi:hypothetical protein